MTVRHMTGRTSDGGGTWEPLPAADYTVQIDNVDWGVNKNSQHTQLVIKGHVVDGPYADKAVTIFYSGSPKSLWKTRALLVAAEVAFDTLDAGPDQDGEAQETYEFDDEHLLGCEVRYTVSQRDYNGKTQNDFNKERSPSGATSAVAAAPRGRTPAAAPAPVAAAPAPAPVGRQRRTAS